MGDRRVITWRSIWLPGSETFIRNQVDSLRTWEAVPVGIWKEDSPLSRTSDQVVFGSGRFERLQRRLFRETRWSPRVERALSETGAQLIHAHFAFDGVQIQPTANRLGLPLVVTLHGHDVTASAKATGKSGEQYRKDLRHLFEGAKKIIAVSEYIAGQAKAYGAPEEKVVVHHIGVPISPFKEPGGDRWDVIFVGRLVEKKGVTDLLTAMSIVDRFQEGRRLCVIGDGPMRGELERLAQELGVEATFLGSLAPVDVTAHLASSKVFAAPSKTAIDGDSEGFGMVFLEAALAGLPVVSYRHGGVTEAVVDNETGLLAPEGDIHTLAANILELLDDSERARSMGMMARLRVTRDFDLSSQTKQLELLYDQAVFS